MLYILNVIYIVTRNHFKMYMFGVVGEKHAHDYFEVISFYNSKDIHNILRYVIDHKLRHMCNLHIKETEISQKRSKGIKNWGFGGSVV